jgi:hypothetical protein
MGTEQSQQHDKQTANYVTKPISDTQRPISNMETANYVETTDYSRIYLMILIFIVGVILGYALCYMRHSNQSTAAPMSSYIQPSS